MSWEAFYLAPPSQACHAPFMLRNSGKKTAVCYCRTSTAKQKKEETIQAQIEHTKRLVSSYGLELLPYGDHGYLIDDGITGSLLEGRAFSKLVSDIKAKVIRPDYIVMYSISRIAREDESSNDPDKVEQSLVDAARIRATLINAKINILDETGISAPDTINFAIKSLLSKEEYKLIRSRTIAGKERCLKEGFFAKGGKAPFGYSYVSTSTETRRGKYKLIANDEEKQSLIRIYNWVIQGGYTYAARMATVNRLPTPMATTKRKGAAKDWTPFRWNPVTVFNLVERARNYLGNITYTFQGEQYTIEAPPLIDLPMYLALQRKKKERKLKSNKQLFLSTGYVNCSCGAHVHTLNYGSGHFTGCKQCRKHIKANAFNRYLWQAVSYRLLRILTVEKQLHTNGNGWNAKLDITQSRLDEVNARIAKLTDIYLNEGLDKDIFRAKNEELNLAKHSLLNDLDNIKSAKEDYERKRVSRATLEDKLSEIIDEVTNHPTLERRREILGNLLQGEQVIVTNWDGMLELRLPAYGSLPPFDVTIGNGLFISYFGPNGIPLAKDDPFYHKFMACVSALDEENTLDKPKSSQSIAIHVKVGEVYWTKVGTYELAVKVKEEIANPNGDRLFKVVSIATGKTLPRPRSSTQLYLKERLDGAKAKQ